VTAQTTPHPPAEAHSVLRALWKMDISGTQLLLAVGKKIKWELQLVPWWRH